MSDSNDKAHYLITIEKIWVTPEGNAGLQSFTGVMCEDEIRAGDFQAEVLDVIENYPPSHIVPGSRLATADEAKAILAIKAMETEVEAADAAGILMDEQKHRRDN